MKLPDVSQFLEQFKAIACSPVPTCVCNCEFDEEGPLKFECEGCKREMPYCYGADDHLPTGESLYPYCDDCAAIISSCYL
ncbi:MAG TPA: hypothetical protein V6C63_12260 [Allocoleopsis sp.]